nr:hypothetical protein CFP56_07668 [Quercus suber]
MRARAWMARSRDCTPGVVQPDKRVVRCRDRGDMASHGRPVAKGHVRGMRTEYSMYCSHRDVCVGEGRCRSRQRRWHVIDGLRLGDRQTWHMLSTCCPSGQPDRPCCDAFDAFSRRAPKLRYIHEPSPVPVTRDSPSTTTTTTTTNTIATDPAIARHAPVLSPPETLLGVQRARVSSGAVDAGEQGDLLRLRSWCPAQNKPPADLVDHQPKPE